MFTIATGHMLMLTCPCPSSMAELVSPLLTVEVNRVVHDHAPHLEGDYSLCVWSFVRLESALYDS